MQTIDQTDLSKTLFYNSFLSSVRSSHANLISHAENWFLHLLFISTKVCLLLYAWKQLPIRSILLSVDLLQSYFQGSFKSTVNSREGERKAQNSTQRTTKTRKAISLCRLIGAFCRSILSCRAAHARPWLKNACKSARNITLARRARQR